MLRHPSRAYVLGVLTLLAHGCLYTNPINMPPTIAIHPPPHVWHNQPAEFTATSADPDGNGPTVWFASAPGDCAQPVPLAEGRTLLANPSGAYSVPASVTAAPFCVWAFATDSHGATVSSSLLVQPEDHPPVADVQIVRPAAIAGDFPLFTELKFSAAASDDVDHDPLAFTWSIASPQPSLVPLFTACSDAAPAPALVPAAVADTTRCFVATVPGPYQLELAVTSGPGATKATARTTLTFDVAPDRMPCIAKASPDLSAPSTLPPALVPPTLLAFEVTRVDDDGDPYPRPLGGTGETQFSWFIGTGATGPLVYVQNSGFPRLSIYPSDYRPGDVLRVRVEIHDRNVAAIDRVLSSCGDDEAICPPASTCFQRKTWRVVIQ